MTKTIPMLTPPFNISAEAINMVAEISVLLERHNMLKEILNTLQKHMKEEVPNKVPNKSECAILRLLSDNPQMTRSELAKNVDLTENGVKKIIANMKALNWIERKGSNKSGYWVVNYRV